MTKTILTITAALALTTPFLATDKKPTTSAIETNNLLAAPIENIVVAGSYSSSYNPGICTRDGVFQPALATDTTVGDFPVPVHCKEPNCGLGVYSRHKDSNEERCSYCSALNTAALAANGD
jgi:hypothetical protein